MTAMNAADDVDVGGLLLLLLLLLLLPPWGMSLWMVRAQHIAACAHACSPLTTIAAKHASCQK
jgi:hypothetical protein